MKTSLSSLLVSTVALLVAAVPGSGADTVAVTGHVLDLVLDPGGKNVGIPDVSVVLTAADGTTIVAENKITDAAGEFLIKKVPTGKATIEFQRMGYVNDPTRIAVTVVNDKDNSFDAYMMLGDPLDKRYSARLASTFVFRAKKSTDAKKSYQLQWDGLARFAASPVAKIELSRQLAELDPVALAAVPVLEEYRGLNAEVLFKTEAKFKEGLKNFKMIPSPREVGEIPKGVAADVLVTLLRSKQFPGDDYKGIIDGFSEYWGGDFGEMVTKRSHPREQFFFPDRIDNP